ncbi:DUF5776 domain-containing protein [Levilactobacillus yonginensis]
MSKLVRRIVLAGLTLSLLGGIVTPTLAQAATTEPGTTATSDPQDTVTYKFDSIQAPYDRITDEQGQTTHTPWFVKKQGVLVPQLYSSADITGDNFKFPFVGAYDNEGDDSRVIAAQMTSLAQNGLTVSPDESFADYIAQPNPPKELSSDELTTYYSDYTYFFAWLFKVGAQTDLHTREFSDIKKEYDGKITDMLNDMYDLSGIKFTGTFNLFFASEDDLNSYLPQIQDLAKSYRYLTDSSEQLVRLDPQASADKERALLNEPLTNFIIKQTDDSNPTKTTYVADGQLSSAVISTTTTCFVYKDDSKPTTPAVTPSATSKPVTVHYVDEQGNTLKPDKTLTGSLGDVYKTAPLSIDGYKLVKTIGDESGKFTSANQSVTYTYRKAAADVAVKDSVVYASKKIGLYGSSSFTKKALKTMYAKKSRMNRPMFKVIGTATSKNGAKRYKVKDLNGNGTTGYITANSDYVAPLYYAKKQSKITVINPSGLNAYSKSNLSGKATHYKQGEVLKVNKIVTRNLTTRLQLSNGKYISANKKLVIAGKYTMPKRVQAKTAINRYDTANLTKRNQHFAKNSTFIVKGWAYSNVNNFRKGDTLRYKVAGGYITANAHLVKTLK